MLKCAILLFVATHYFHEFQVSALWDQDVSCPLICTCRLEHVTETAIYRFMVKNKKRTKDRTDDSVENNDVLYEENVDTLEILEEHSSNPIIRSATCILQTETDPPKLLQDLPQNIESITLIQGYESGNKTIKFSYLNNFSQLISLELVGPSLFNKNTNSHLISDIDSTLSDLKYLNLERILIRNSKKQLINFLKEVQEENITFEYTLKLDSITHSLTMVRKGTNDAEIVPYEVFKQQRESTGNTPLLIGFKSLLLLRITNCELNNVNWEMFDGLSKLEYLILEKNNLRFIPAFAFYGTSSLKTLSLAHNKLLDIQITDLAGLLQLKYLDLSFNNFTQLSELSLPPFPKLKLANFANNPISVIFPNTFEVMNTTNSLVIGSDDIPLIITTNSLVGLSSLEKLTINNVKLQLLKGDMFVGMPNLKELTLTGNITELEYDTFLEVNQIERLILTNCQIRDISMDSFIGLQELRHLDLSKNQLEYLPPGIFDDLHAIKELYLNSNKFKKLPRDIFSKIHPKLIRLNDNPWHCSCEMSEWKPLIINRIKQKGIKPCAFSGDKGINCNTENQFTFKYIFDNKVAPKCAEPAHFVNWSVFHAMRRIFRCPDYKPRLKKHHSVGKYVTDTVTRLNQNTDILTTQKHLTELPKVDLKMKKLNYKLTKHELTDLAIDPTKLLHLNSDNTELNSISLLNNYKLKNSNHLFLKKVARTRKKYTKGYNNSLNSMNETENNII